MIDDEGQNGIGDAVAELDGETAKAIVERQFVEVIIAPKVSQAARDVVAAKEGSAILVNVWVGGQSVSAYDL